MPMATAETRRDYQREWLARRRQKAIDLLGGKCAKCRATENLEIDHIDPETKDPKLKGKLRQGFPWSWAWSRILVELAKCQLLCRDCHAAKTLPQISRKYCPKGHDTEVTGRSKNHRCLACRREYEYPNRKR